MSGAATMVVSVARIATTLLTCCSMGIRCARLTPTNAPFLLRGTTELSLSFYYGGSVASIDRHFGPMKRPSTDEMDFLRNGPVDIACKFCGAHVYTAIKCRIAPSPHWEDFQTFGSATMTIQQRIEDAAPGKGVMGIMSVGESQVLVHVDV